MRVLNRILMQGLRTRKLNWGGIIRNLVGEVVATYHGQIEASSPFYGEAEALLLGLRVVELLKIDLVEVEGDCITLINTVKKKQVGEWKACTVMFQIWRKIVSMSVSFTLRESNNIADAIV